MDDDMDMDIDVVLVEKPSWEELGRMACRMLDRHRYVIKVWHLMRSLGIFISRDKLKWLLRTYCPDLYYFVIDTNTAKYLRKVFARST